MVGPWLEHNPAEGGVRVTRTVRAPGESTAARVGKPRTRRAADDDARAWNPRVTCQGCRASHARRLAPAVLRYIEDNAIYVFELLLSVNARVVGQLHEEFAAVTLDPILGRAFVLDDEPKVMQSRPLRAAMPTFGSLGEMQQREVHHAVR